MSTDVIFLGWNRSVPGREQISAAHFQELLGFMAERQQSGAIDSFEVVLLGQHGGNLNGFFLIRGDNERLNALQANGDFQMHLTRGEYHLQDFGWIRGVTGEGVMEWMTRWAAVISS